MKKKVLAVLLSGCMVAGLLAGCGGKKEEASDKAAGTDTKTEDTSEGSDKGG